MVNFPPEGSEQEAPFFRRYYDKMIRQALDAKGLVAMAQRQLSQADTTMKAIDDELFKVDTGFLDEAEGSLYEQQDELRDFISDLRSERSEW